MPVNFFNPPTALNRLKVGLGALAVTPSAGQSVDAQGAAGQLVIGTSSLAPNSGTGVLVTISLNFPSFSYSGRTANLVTAPPLSGNPSSNGSAAKAEIRDHAGLTQINGLTVGVTGSGADIIVASTTIAVGTPATVASGSLSE